MKNWLLLAVLLGVHAILEARDLNVEIVNDETGEAIVGLDLVITTPSGDKISSVKYDAQKRSYIFEGLPEGELTISIDDQTQTALKKITSEDKNYVKIGISGYPQDNQTNKVTQLDEVEVVAASQFVTRHGLTYIPNKKQKKTSHSGVSLLQRMGIPSLTISPINETVTTMKGEDVSFFIDYVEADQSIIANIWPKEVEKVEVLENPSDPRFKNARHVVNFIMVKYEWGGYTKFNGNQTLEELAGAYSAYSKAAYRRMTYEVGIGADYNNSKNIGNEEETEYIFPNSTLNIIEDLHTKSKKRTGWYATARIGYNDERNNVSNDLTYVGDKSPAATQKGSIRYAPPIYADSEQQSTRNSKYQDIMWTNNDTFNLGNGWSISARNVARYTVNDYNYLYQTSGTEINNIANGKRWVAAANCCGWKQLGNHQIYLQLEGTLQSNYLKYEGTNPSYEIARDHLYGFQTGGIFLFGKIKTSLNVGFLCDTQSMGKYSDTQNRGMLTGEFSYYINQKNSLSFQLDWNMPSPDISQLNPNLIIQTETFASKGNNYLKHYHITNMNAGYNWLPLNNLGFYGMIGWQRYFHPIVAIYEPEIIAGKEMMVMTFKNEGFMSSIYAAVSGNLNLFNNSLSVNAGAYYSQNALRTAFNKDTSTVRINANIYYTWRNFFISASYQSPFAALNFSQWSKQPCYYNMKLGYGNGDLYVDFEMRNIFRSHWKSSEFNYISDFYTTDGRSYGGTFHRNFKITLSYSFGYGKKLNKAGEISKASMISTGI